MNKHFLLFYRDFKKKKERKGTKIHTLKCLGGNILSDVWCVGDKGSLPLISGLFSKCFFKAVQPVSLGFWVSYFWALAEIALPAGIKIGNGLSNTC